MAKYVILKGLNLDPSIQLPSVSLRKEIKYRTANLVAEYMPGNSVLSNGIVSSVPNDRGSQPIVSSSDAVAPTVSSGLFVNDTGTKRLISGPSKPAGNPLEPSLTGKDFTAIFNFNAKDLTSASTVLGLILIDGFSIRFNISNARTLRIQRTAVGQSVVVQNTPSTSLIDANVLNNLAFRRTGNTIDLYINGAIFFSYTHPSYSMEANGTKILVYGSMGNDSNGRLQADYGTLRIYDAAISESDINQIINLKD